MPDRYDRAFKQCDVRGCYPEEVNEELAHRLGRAVGEVAGNAPVVVAGDGRISTPSLKEHLLAGLAEAGAAPVDCGTLPTPGYYFARLALGAQVGVMVTASHSPPDHNGFKPVLGPLPITPEELARLHEAVDRNDFLPAVAGRVTHRSMRDEYVAWMVDTWREELGPPARELRMVVDCGNGGHSDTAPEVLTALGIDHVPLFCEPDGSFPNRSPDVSRPEALAELAEVVRQCGADLGVAFDGDGDRVAFVDERGGLLGSDALVAVMARDLLARRGPGTVVLDIKLSQAVEDVVKEAGGQPVRERSGHTFMKTRMIRTAAVLGGEMSGHVFFGDLHGGDDGLYAALVMIELLGRAGRPVSQVAASVPRYAATGDLRVPFDGDPVALQERLAAHAGQAARIERLDGVKAHYADGWALLRASVTEPAITMRFEGWDGEALRRVILHFLAPEPELLEHALAAAGQARGA